MNLSTRRTRRQTRLSHRALLLLFLPVLVCAPPSQAQAGATGTAIDAPGDHPASDRMAAEVAATDLSRKAAKGDTAALAALAKAADRGDAPSQFRLATLYKDGLGVPRDDALYAAWLLKAAAQGHAGAQSRLIGVYEEGIGVPADAAQAAQWARRAADQGELAGQLALVKDYYFGRGVARSLVEAIKWQAILELRGIVASDDDFTRQLEAEAGVVQAAEGRALAREWIRSAR